MSGISRIGAASPEQWKAKFAGERIAVITSDAGLEQRIRSLFCGESYEVICVSDFFAHQDELIDTSVGIVDTRSPDSFETIYRMGKHIFWEPYPTIRIVTEEHFLRDRVHGYAASPLDVEISEAVLSDLPDLTKRQIHFARLLDA